MQISVIILCWNSQQHIRECLTSLLASLSGDFEQFEIFIVDNGSNDQTLKIIDEYVCNNPKTIKPILLNSNTGTTYSRNLALKQATGDFIAVLDSDVIVPQGIFQDLLDSLTISPEIGMVVPKLVYGNGKFQKSTDDFPTLLKKLRSQIRKAEKNGLSFSWGSEKDIDAFYHVFSRNMHELGSPVHSKKWIEQILLNYGDNARMGLVFKENQPVGCGIILFTKHSVSIPWASTLREYNKLSPNMMLYWNFLKFAADTGKKVFDFGRSTLNEGTYKFKKQWGTEPEQLFWYSVNETPQTSEEAAMGKNRVRLEQIWQKMPISLVNFIGPKVRKYISL